MHLIQLDIIGIKTATSLTIFLSSVYKSYVKLSDILRSNMQSGVLSL